LNSIFIFLVPDPPKNTVFDLATHVSRRSTLSPRSSSLQTVESLHLCSPPEPRDHPPVAGNSLRQHLELFHEMFSASSPSSQESSLLGHYLFFLASNPLQNRDLCIVGSLDTLHVNGEAARCQIEGRQSRHHSSARSFPTEKFISSRFSPLSL
jgi:hypothetical protein